MGYYEYKYGLVADESMIPRYMSWNASKPEIKFVFETRTNFVVKRTSGEEETIESEVVERGAEENMIGESALYILLSMRLQEYWMPAVEICALVREASAFARQKEADPQFASLPFVPIAIELDVCTVQKAGEPIGEVLDRAIRAQHLYPASLIQNRSGAEPCSEDTRKLLYWLRCLLEKHRVDETTLASALCRMPTCPLCSRNPTIGAQIAMLEDCQHHFHYHCILASLLDQNQTDKSCPVCAHPISI